MFLNAFRCLRGASPAQGELVEAKVSHGDFAEAIRKVSRSVGPADLEQYASWMAAYGAS